MRSESRFRAQASAGVDALQQQLSRRAPTDADGGSRPARPRTTSRYREVSPERDDEDEPAPLANSTASIASERSPLLPPAPSADASRRDDGRAAKRPRAKMGTFEGVFVPVSLNIVGIILFLRFGFLIGQAGLLGTVLLLAVAYLVRDC